MIDAADAHDGAGTGVPAGAPPPLDPDDPRVEIRRSARRTRTVQARREGDKVVVLVPARLTARRERELVAQMLERVARAGRRTRPGSGDDELAARSRQLSARYLGGRARPVAVRWVPPMRTRWGSCSQDSGVIRVSESLREVPGYVLDYVLVHELAHLVVAGGHTPQFWEAVGAYPRTERARGYLEAYARHVGAGTPGAADDSDADANADGDCDLDSASDAGD